jgi:hypothetical protein
MINHDSIKNFLFDAKFSKAINPDYTLLPELSEKIKTIIEEGTCLSITKIFMQK